MDPPHFTLLGVSLKLLAIFFLVFLNGFFVAAEFAIVKVRSTQIEALARKRHRRAKVAENVIRHLDAYLSATQLGITLASLAWAGWGNPLWPRCSGRCSRGWGFTRRRWSIPFPLPSGQLHHLSSHRGGRTGAEVAGHPEGSRHGALGRHPLTFFYKGFYPAIWLLNGVANRILKAVGLRPASEQELGHSEEELRLLLSESNPGEGQESLSRRILRRTFSLKSLQARNIMLPRNKIDALFLEMSLDRNLEIAKVNHHTRFPVCRKTLDDVVGMVHIKHLLWKIQSQTEPVNLESICRQILFFPEFASLETMLKTFLQRKCHMGVIVDEFGGTLGLVTLEDILEELVGEIQDEFDQEAPLIVKLGDGKYLVDGSTPLHDLEEAFGTQFNGDHDVTTLGGYLVNHWRNIPSEGAEAIHDNLKLVVRRVEKLRVSQVLVQILKPEPTET